MIDLFKKKSRSFLGVDIGTTGIRMVQLGLDSEGIKLENYAYNPCPLELILSAILGNYLSSQIQRH